MHRVGRYSRHSRNLALRYFALPERMCLILVGSSGFVSSDKEAIRNEEWDQGSRIKARDLRYRASYRKSKEAVLCRFTPGF